MVSFHDSAKLYLIVVNLFCYCNLHETGIGSAGKCIWFRILIFSNRCALFYQHVVLVEEDCRAA